MKGVPVGERVRVRGDVIASMPRAKQSHLFLPAPLEMQFLMGSFPRLLSFPRRRESKGVNSNRNPVLV